MRFYVVLRYIALTLLLNSAFMLISAGVSFYYSDETVIPLLYSALITGLFGLFPLIFIPVVESISNKEGLFIVVASWFTFLSLSMSIDITLLVYDKVY